MNSLKIKINELDIELLYTSGGMPCQVPTDPLYRQLMVKEAQQARRETKQAEATSSLDVKPAFPLTMSDQQWKFEQKRDTTCREMRAYVEKKRLSLIPEVRTLSNYMDRRLQSISQAGYSISTRQETNT